MRPGRAVVIGIGNPYRRDDGVGPAVAARIGDLGVPGVKICRMRVADPSALLEAWAGADVAVLVDAAVSTPHQPGRIRRIDADAAMDGDGRLSTHGLGIGQALRLGAVLGQSPGRLVVLTVDAADLGMGPHLSLEVTAAVPVLVGAVLDELARTSAGRAPA